MDSAPPAAWASSSVPDEPRTLCRAHKQTHSHEAGPPVPPANIERDQVADQHGAMHEAIRDRDCAAAETAVEAHFSDTMLHAWRRAANCPTDMQPQHMWLFVIAANVLANHRRSTSRRLRLVNKLRDHMIDKDAVDPAEPSAVRDAVLRLHDAHRELVMLVHWDGMTIAEAAEVLGVNASTARSRYAVARQALHETMSLTTVD